MPEWVSVSGLQSALQSKAPHSPGEGPMGTHGSPADNWSPLTGHALPAGEGSVLEGSV